jgi:hypothetical protein
VTGAELAQLITAMATLVTAVSALVVGIRNSRKIEEVHKSTNGKMEELLNVTRDAAHAKGMKDEKDGAK